MSIEIRGLDETIEMLDGVAERIEDVSPATAEPAQKLVAYMRQRFQTRTAPDGSAWEPLKPSTVQGREVTGTLEGSVFAVATPEGVRFGATAPYAAYQNAKRRFTPSTAEEVDAASGITEAITKYVVGE